MSDFVFIVRQKLLGVVLLLNIAKLLIKSGL